MSDENKAVVRRWLAAWNEGSAAVLDEICAEEYMEYDPAYPGGRLPLRGVKQAMPAIRASLPDLRFVAQEMIAEGDKVAVHWTASGTFLGEINGIPPTGKRGHSEGVTFFTLRDGELVEAHAFWDTAAWRVQIGLPPPT